MYFLAFPNNRSKRWCVILLLLAPLLAVAHDLGVFARVWAIQELNLKQVIARQLQQLDQKALVATLRQQAIDWDAHLPVYSLPTASTTGTTYFDPSVALDRNIVVAGRPLYRKGTWVNPLHWIRPTSNLLFFDGRDADQRAFVQTALRDYPLHLLPVMTAGRPLKLAASIGRPVYYASQALLKRFQVRNVPTLLTAGTGEHRTQLAVVTLAPPYQLTTLQRCWHGCSAVSP